MSKSKRNVIDPDEILKVYGADTARWFMLSDSPPERDVEWSEAGIEGAAAFLQRVWRLVAEAIERGSTPAAPISATADTATALVRARASQTTANVEAEIDGLRFNRAVAQIYELTNAPYKFLMILSDAPTLGELVGTAGLASPSWCSCSRR